MVPGELFDARHSFRMLRQIKTHICLILVRKHVSSLPAARMISAREFQAKRIDLWLLSLPLLI